VLMRHLRNSCVHVYTYVRMCVIYVYVFMCIYNLCHLVEPPLWKHLVPTSGKTKRGLDLEMRFPLERPHRHELGDR
jgi:hypothetical protein